MYSIVYDITCKNCGDKYVGETSRNGHTRSTEHVKDSKSKNKQQREKSVILRHMNEKHDGNKVDFEMESS